MDEVADTVAPCQASIPEPTSSSAPSKRRWTPCTWRYAIEEVQPELVSRTRYSHILSTSSAPSERQRPPDPPTKRASEESAGNSSPGVYDYILTGQISGNASWEKVGERKEHGQQEAEIGEERMGRALKTENRDRTVEASWSRRRKREMSPSELYFCDECAQKRSNGRGSPSSPSDSC